MAFIAPILEAVAAGGAEAGAVGAAGAAEAGAAGAAEGAAAGAAGGEGAVGGLGGQAKNLSSTQFGGGGQKQGKQLPTTPQVGGNPNDFDDPGYVS